MCQIGDLSMKKEILNLRGPFNYPTSYSCPSYTVLSANITFTGVMFLKYRENITLSLLISPLWELGF